MKIYAREALVHLVMELNEPMRRDVALALLVRRMDAKGHLLWRDESTGCDALVRCLVSDLVKDAVDNFVWGRANGFTKYEARDMAKLYIADVVRMTGTPEGVKVALEAIRHYLPTDYYDLDYEADDPLVYFLAGPLKELERLSTPKEVQ